MSNHDVKETWYNELRCLLSYIVAKAFQNTSWDFLSKLSEWLSPFPKVENTIDPVMVEVIRERMGISQEDFNRRIEDIRKDTEREEMGLPK